MAGRHRTQERLAVGLAAVVAMVLVLVAPVQLSAAGIAVGESCADASTAQATITIGMVVDFGVLEDPGDPGSQVVTCVPVAAGTKGFDLLTAAGHQYRVDDSGLLCAIDGRPATGCGERTPTGYRYWAYFHGSGSSWSYSSIGPGGYRASAGAVEGWHFVEGAGNPTDPPPRRAPTNICPVTPPPTNPPPTAPPVAPTNPSPSPTTVTPAGGGGSGGSPATPGPGGAPATNGGANPSVTATTVAGGAATTAVPGADGTDPGLATAPSDPSGTTPGPSGAPDGTTPSGAATDGSATDVTILAAAQGSTSSEGGGAPIATLLAIAVIVGVGGAAAWKLRSRPDDLA